MKECEETSKPTESGVTGSIDGTLAIDNSIWVAVHPLGIGSRRDVEGKTENASSFGISALARLGTFKPLLLHPPAYFSGIHKTPTGSTTLSSITQDELTHAADGAVSGGDQHETGRGGDIVRREQRVQVSMQLKWKELAE